MQLRLTDKDQLLTVDFGEWLIPFIQTKLLSSIGNYNFKSWDKHLTESVTLPRLYKRNYTASEVVTFAAKNFICIGSDGDITIKINDTKFVPGFDCVKLKTLIKTIDYGTLQTKGAPIIRDTLNYFANNIDIYVRKYYGI